MRANTEWFMSRLDRYLYPVEASVPNHSFAFLPHPDGVSTLSLPLSPHPDGDSTPSLPLFPQPDWF